MNAGVALTWFLLARTGGPCGETAASGKLELPTGQISDHFRPSLVHQTRRWHLESFPEKQKFAEESHPIKLKRTAHSADGARTIEQFRRQARSDGSPNMEDE